MPSNSAEYMREYRRRKTKARRAIEGIHAALATTVSPEEALDEARQFATDYATLSNDQARRIRELEQEVAHLKRELAARPTPHAYSSRPFTPVPKSGKRS